MSLWAEAAFFAVSMLLIAAGLALIWLPLGLIFAGVAVFLLYRGIEVRLSKQPDGRAYKAVEQAGD